jgi:F-type H+-transporting ATPase subunit b
MLELLAEAAHGGEGAHEFVEPAAFGFLTPPMAVALAMAVLLLILWRVGVPGMIAGALDSRIADIRKQLEEAKALRLEAEALKVRYEQQMKAADADIAELRAHADTEAKSIIAKAKVDAEALIQRRQRMAEDKIGAAERAAVAELRARAAQAASEAAQGLIAKNHSAAADKALVDQAIGSI